MCSHSPASAGAHSQRVEAAKAGRSWRGGRIWHRKTKRAMWLWEEDWTQGWEGEVSLHTGFLGSSFSSASGYELGKLFPVYLLSLETIFGKIVIRGSAAQCSWANLQTSYCVSLCGGFCTLPLEAAGLLALPDCRAHFPCMRTKEAIPISPVITALSSWFRFRHASFQCYARLNI